jgi:hypothetical protein
MAHPYKQHMGKYAHPHSRERVKKMFGKFAKGGAVHPDEAEDKKLIKKELAKHDMKAEGHKGKARLDKHARGGKVKHGGAKHHTKINIMVAPKAGGDAPGAAPMAPPMAPPMPPKGPMMPPPGGPMAGGPPGAGPGGPPPPGMPGMKRGGGVKPKSGISSPENLKTWEGYAKSNTRYERGGGVPVKRMTGPMKGGAGGAEGRLDKQKAYGNRSKKNGPI